jgi:hypothetical protein
MVAVSVEECLGLLLPGSVEQEVMVIVLVLMSGVYVDVLTVTLVRAG